MSYFIYHPWSRFLTYIYIYIYIYIYTYIIFSLSHSKRNVMEINGAQLYLPPKAQTFIYLKHKSIQLSNISIFTKPWLLFFWQVVYTTFDELHCLMQPRKWSLQMGNHLFCTDQAVLTGANPDQGRLFWIGPHQNDFVEWEMRKQPDTRLGWFMFF